MILVFLSVLINLFAKRFESAKEKWIYEVAHHCPHTPQILVGTQIDLRSDPYVLNDLRKNKQKPITYEQGEQLVRELKSVNKMKYLSKYVECSSLTQVNNI